MTISSLARSSVPFLFSIMFALVLALGLGQFYTCGAAHADPAAVVVAPPPMVDQPVVTSDELVAVLTDGQYVPAIGIILIALVAALRGGLGRSISWFKTKAGGYALNFGTVASLYVGVAFRAGQAPTIGLFLSALGTGAAAAGGWEAILDLIHWYRGKSDPVTTLPTAEAKNSTSKEPK